MQQRQLRLGDILDDYCPRERRITNHAIVAIVGQEVRQTRCVTCEAEHEYKQARVPPQRKKKPVPGALYQEVLAGMPAPAPTRAVAQGAAVTVDEDEERVEALEEPLAAEPADAGASGSGDESEGPVHRPLIRATLPRPEGQVPVRPIPDFTVRQPNTRPGRFRPNGAPRRPGHPGAQGQQGQGFGANGRRGAAPQGRPAHGNRAHPPPGERPGPPRRRRGGRKRMK